MRILTAALIAASLSLPAWAIEGAYTVEGTDLATGKPYKGGATILKVGEVYRLTWTFGNQTNQGVGILEGDVLAVAVDKLVVAYKVRPDGVLVGRWTSLTATKTAVESFTPRR